MYNFHLNVKNDISLIIYPIYNFLTINFCENLQEYFFVQNQILILEIMKKNAQILN